MPSGRDGRVQGSGDALFGTIGVDSGGVTLPRSVSDNYYRSRVFDSSCATYVGTASPADNLDGEVGRWSLGDGSNYPEQGDSAWIFSPFLNASIESSYTAYPSDVFLNVRAKMSSYGPDNPESDFLPTELGTYLSARPFVLYFKKGNSSWGLMIGSSRVSIAGNFFWGVHAFRVTNNAWNIEPLISTSSGNAYLLPTNTYKNFQLRRIGNSLSVRVDNETDWYTFLGFVMSGAMSFGGKFVDFDPNPIYDFQGYAWIDHINTISGFPANYETAERSLPVQMYPSRLRAVLLKGGAGATSVYFKQGAGSFQLADEVDTDTYELPGLPYNTAWSYKIVRATSLSGDLVEANVVDRVDWTLMPGELSLSISSTGTSVNVVVNPADNTSSTGGSTPLNLTYYVGSFVTLDFPLSKAGYVLTSATLNGNAINPNTLRTGITLNVNSTVVLNYSTFAGLFSLEVKSDPVTSVSINMTPGGSVLTNHSFVGIVGGIVIEAVAPNAHSGYVFDRWELKELGSGDVVSTTSSSKIAFSMLDNYVLTAYYVEASPCLELSFTSSLIPVCIEIDQDDNYGRSDGMTSMVRNYFRDRTLKISTDQSVVYDGVEYNFVRWEIKEPSGGTYTLTTASFISRFLSGSYKIHVVMAKS